MYLGILPAFMSVYHVCNLFPRRSEKGISGSGTRVVDACEPLCGCWEPNIGPLQEWQMLLTAETSLLSLFVVLTHTFLISNDIGHLCHL